MHPEDVLCNEYHEWIRTQLGTDRRYRLSADELLHEEWDNLSYEQRMWLIDFIERWEVATSYQPN